MDKYIIITGATSGIGKATAIQLAEKGNHLILTGRRKERLDQIKLDLEKFPIKVITLAFDVRDFEACQHAFSSLDEQVRHNIYGLINNAGLAVGRDTIDVGELEDWNRMIDTNVKGLLHVSKLIIPYLKTNLEGHIINIASIAGKEVYPSGNVYCASKAAVDSLSKAMRIDLLPYQIKVTNIAPGAIETEFSIVRFKGNEATAKSVYEGFHPLLPEDIAQTIEYVLGLPAHVNINDLTIMPTAQATGTIFHKK